MADTTAQTISIQSAADLERFAKREELENLVTGNIEQVRQATHAIRERLQRENPAATIYFDDNIINAVLAAHPLQKEDAFRDSSSRDRKREDPLASSTGSLLGLAGASLLPTSREDKIQDNIELRQKEQLKNEFSQLLEEIDTLEKKGQAFTPEQKQELIRQKLAGVTSRSLLEGQGSIAEELLSRRDSIGPQTPDEQQVSDQEIKKTTDILSEARTKEISRITEGERREKEKLEQANAKSKNPMPQENDIETSRITAGFWDLDKEFERLTKGKNLSSEQIEKIQKNILQKKLELLDRFIGRKQNTVRTSAKSILFGKRSGLLRLRKEGGLSTQIKKRLVRVVKKDRREERQQARLAKKEKRAKEQAFGKEEEEKDKTESQQSADFRLIRRLFQRELAQEEPSLPENTFSESQAPSPSQGSGGGLPSKLGNKVFDGLKNILNNFGKNLTTQGIKAGGALFANPGTGTVIGVVVGIILLIIFIVIIFLVINNLLHMNTSNEKVTGVTCAGDVVAVGALNAENFQTTMFRRYNVDVVVDPNLAKDHTNVIVQKQIYNDLCLLFGDSAKNDITQSFDMNTFGTDTVGTPNQIQHHQEMEIHYIVNKEDPTTTCGIVLDTKTTKPNDAWWIINNPLGCLADPGVFDFLFAQSLARNLMLQQQYLHNGNVDDFNKYKDDIFPNEQIPTKNCFSTQKAEDCFTDTVAAYFTWGYPYVSSQSPTETPVPTPTPPTSTTSTVTLSSLLGTLGLFPETYPNTYIFTKTFLFNDVGFFSKYGQKTPPYYPKDYPAAMAQEFGVVLFTDVGSSTYVGSKTVAWPDNYMKWAWEAFWNMPDVFIKGIKHTSMIYIVSGNDGSVTDCSGGHCYVQLRSVYSEQQFKAILTHEFSHVFDFTNTGGDSVQTYRTEIDNVYAAEGGLTFYSQGCGGSMDYATRMKEDYAETLTYYIYPDIPESTNCSDGGNNNRYPYKNGAHPLHYALAQKILGNQ